MSGNGTVPKSQLSVTSTNGTNGTTFTIQSPVQGYTTPTWESVLLSPGNNNVKTVTVQPVDSLGNPVGSPQTIVVTDPTQPINFNFNTPVTADKLVVTLTPINASLPITADIVDVYACLPAPGIYIMIRLILLIRFCIEL